MAQQPAGPSWPRWVRIGAEVEVTDAAGFPWPAKVTAIVNDGDATTIRVTYPGWRKKFDEDVADAARVRRGRGASKSALERAEKRLERLERAEKRLGRLERAKSRKEAAACREEPQPAPLRQTHSLRGPA